MLLGETSFPFPRSLSNRCKKHRSSTMHTSTDSGSILTSKMQVPGNPISLYKNIKKMHRKGHEKLITAMCLTSPNLPVSKGYKFHFLFSLRFLNQMIKYTWDHTCMHVAIPRAWSGLPSTLTVTERPLSLSTTSAPVHIPPASLFFWMGDALKIIYSENNFLRKSRCFPPLYPHKCQRQTKFQTKKKNSLSLFMYNLAFYFQSWVIFSFHFTQRSCINKWKIITLQVSDLMYSLLSFFKVV